MFPMHQIQKNEIVIFMWNEGITYLHSSNITLMFLYGVHVPYLTLSH
jgi:hypothetical protein